jgi:phage terminase large subunit
VTIVKNQGAGAAMKRVEAGRRLFPSCWFNESTCAGGIEALSWYHEQIHKVSGMGLGPEHDWSSHAADAFGMLAVVMSNNLTEDVWHSDIDYSRMDRGIR